MLIKFQFLSTSPILIHNSLIFNIYKKCAQYVTCKKMIPELIQIDTKRGFLGLFCVFNYLIVNILLSLWIVSSWAQTNAGRSVKTGLPAFVVSTDTQILIHSHELQTS